MLKNRIAVTFLALVLACGAAFAGEPADEMDAALAAMKDEPPITQADIDIVAKIAKDVNAAMSNDDQDAATKVCEDNNFTFQRYHAVSIKLGIGFMMVQMKEQMTREVILASGQTPKFMIPTDDELAIRWQVLSLLAVVFCFCTASISSAAHSGLSDSQLRDHDAPTLSPRP